MITGRPGAGRGGWWIAMMLVAVALVFDFAPLERASLLAYDAAEPVFRQPARATGPSSLPSMRRVSARSDAGPGTAACMANWFDG